jgi:hypothetical protein
MRRFASRQVEQGAVRRGSGHPFGSPDGDVGRGRDARTVDADSIAVAGPVHLAAAGVGDDQHLAAGPVSDGIQ